MDTYYVLGTMLKALFGCHFTIATLRGQVLFLFTDKLRFMKIIQCHTYSMSQSKQVVESIYELLQCDSKVSTTDNSNYNWVFSIPGKLESGASISEND